MCPKVFSAFLVGAALLSADSLVFKNGNVLTGEFVEADAHEIRFIVQNASKATTYPIDSVKRLTFDSGSTSATPAAASTPATTHSDSFQTPSSLASPKTSQVKKITAMDVAVELKEAINQQNATLGKSYACTVFQPLQQGTETVIPAGSPCTIKVIPKPATLPNADKYVALVQLDTITIGSKTYTVRSSQKAILPKPKGYRTAFGLMDDIVL
jgi:hypothetical protein